MAEKQTDVARREGNLLRKDQFQTAHPRMLDRFSDQMDRLFGAALEVG